MQPSYTYHYIFIGMSRANGQDQVDQWHTKWDQMESAMETPILFSIRSITLSGSSWIGARRIGSSDLPDGSDESLFSDMGTCIVQL